MIIKITVFTSVCVLWVHRLSCTHARTRSSIDTYDHNRQRVHLLCGLWVYTALFFDELDAIRNSLAPDTDIAEDDVINTTPPISDTSLSTSSASQSNVDTSQSDSNASQSPLHTHVSASSMATGARTMTSPLRSPIVTAATVIGKFGTPTATGADTEPKSPPDVHRHRDNNEYVAVRSNIVTNEDASPPASPEQVEVDADTISFV